MSKKPVKTNVTGEEVKLRIVKQGTPAPKVTSGDQEFDAFLSDALQTIFKPKK